MLHALKAFAMIFLFFRSRASTRKQNEKASRKNSSEQENEGKSAAKSKFDALTTFGFTFASICRLDSRYLGSALDDVIKKSRSRNVQSSGWEISGENSGLMEKKSN